MPRASTVVGSRARSRRGPGGGSWLNDDNAGSRQANVGNNWPENSNDNIGARGRCDPDDTCAASVTAAPAGHIPQGTTKVGGQPGCPASANTLHGPAERGVGGRKPVRDPRPALLLLACSATKKTASASERMPFADLYDGPLWRQVRASCFPASRTAAFSALHGLLLPPAEIGSYDCKLDLARAAAFGRDPAFVAAIETFASDAAELFVVAGGHYRMAVRLAIRCLPPIEAVTVFAEGSFLALRRQLGDWLRVHAA